MNHKKNWLSPVTVILLGTVMFPFSVVRANLQEGNQSSLSEESMSELGKPSSLNQLFRSAKPDPEKGDLMLSGGSLAKVKIKLGSKVLSTEYLYCDSQKGLQVGVPIEPLSSGQKRIKTLTYDEQGLKAEGISLEANPKASQIKFELALYLMQRHAEAPEAQRMIKQLIGIDLTSGEANQSGSSETLKQGNSTHDDSDPAKQGRPVATESAKRRADSLLHYLEDSSKWKEEVNSNGDSVYRKEEMTFLLKPQEKKSLEALLVFVTKGAIPDRGEATPPVIKKENENTPTTTPVPSSSISEQELARIARRMAVINRVRAQNGLAPLAYDPETIENYRQQTQAAIDEINRERRKSGKRDVKFDYVLSAIAITNNDLGGNGHRYTENTAQVWALSRDFIGAVNTWIYRDRAWNNAHQRIVLGDRSKVGVASKNGQQTANFE